MIDLVKESLAVMPGKPEDAFCQAFQSALESLLIGDGPWELHDWGGVLSHAIDGNRSILCPGSATSYVFSFTPWNAKGKAELPKMMDFAKSAGFAGMIIMTCKEGRGGKADVFANIRKLRPDAVITYYEDTYDVIKQCVSSNTICYHVPSPEFPVEEGDKVPGVVNGSINGYLERWVASSSARPVAAAARVQNGAEPAEDCRRGQKIRKKSDPYPKPTYIIIDINVSGRKMQYIVKDEHGTESAIEPEEIETAEDSPKPAASVDLPDLDRYLAHHSYFGSEICATEVDYKQSYMLSNTEVDPHIFPNLHRWRRHISFLEARFGNFDVWGHPIPIGKEALK